MSKLKVHFTGNSPFATSDCYHSIFLDIIAMSFMTFCSCSLLILPKKQRKEQQSRRISIFNARMLARHAVGGSFVIDTRECSLFPHPENQHQSSLYAIAKYQTDKITAPQSHASKLDTFQACSVAQQTCCGIFQFHIIISVKRSASVSKLIRQFTSYVG